MKIEVYASISSGFVIKAGPAELKFERAEFKELLRQILELTGKPDSDTADLSASLKWLAEIDQWTKKVEGN
jgi:hypothetical protein